MKYLSPLSGSDVQYKLRNFGLIGQCGRDDARTFYSLLSEALIIKFSD